MTVLDLLKQELEECLKDKKEAEEYEKDLRQSISILDNAHKIYIDEAVSPDISTYLLYNCFERNPGILTARQGYCFEKELQGIKYEAGRSTFSIGVETICAHENLKTYTGLNESYRYCEDCGVRL